ncbi:TetR/AcrR family transcriptional regulator [Actinoplanes sp. N902-109]|uniref:TetR/AcrR family transcriptional regulator n=1 Tax=Actinoplanes sp. (strain N902-109) TaxID=649831 RepID=UPI001E2AF9D6|nr:TetR/AcrR family transcriptional regulator [Actinoplanes sp. N902-109]
MSSPETPPVATDSMSASAAARVRSPRRTDALSRERVVQASIELLDAAGEDGLTVRALTTHLATGRGALYHHVTGKDDLLAAATDGIIGPIVAVADAAADEEDPEQALRGLALKIFDAIDAHPWVGMQLSRRPQPAVFRLWRRIGSLLSELGVSGTGLSDAGSAFLGYILGTTAQYAAGARRATDDAAREKYLAELAAHWIDDDADPLTRQAATDLIEHDDRDQFRAGVDIFLAGIRALHRGVTTEHSSAGEDQ